MTFASLSSLALSTDYYASNSRLASGNWVKVRVTTEGMQQITYDQLREWGFANPKNVKVYGYGGTILTDHVFSTQKPDDVQPTLSIHTDDGRLIFFGDADVRTTLNGTDSNNNLLYTVHRNYSSSTGYYLLTDSEVGGTLPAAAAYTASSAEAVSQHLSVNLYEKEALPVTSQTCVYHSQTYNSGDDIKTTFAIRDFAGGSDSYATYTVEVPILNTATWTTYTIDGATCDNLNLTTTEECSVETCYDGSLNYATGIGRSRVAPLDGATTIDDGEYTFSSNVTENTKLSYVALDRAVLVYPRKNILHENSGSLIMNFQTVSANSNFAVDGATANTHVWNISDPSQVFEQQGNYDDANATFTGTFDRAYAASNGACRLIAFNVNEEQNDVEYVGTVANQNLHSMATPNMLIITTDELYDYAEKLADIHRKYDNMDVLVLTQQQIFNEFGSGTPGAMAVRRAIKMFYDRNSSKLKNVIMYGKGLADFRQLTNHTSYEPLITFEVEPITKDWQEGAASSHLNFASDDYFACLKDTDEPTRYTVNTAKLDIAIGRIPAGNSGYATDVNAKIESYINNPLPANAMMRALFTSDNGDTNQHYKQSTNIISVMSAGKPAMTNIQGHCLIYPHTESKAASLNNVISDALAKGVGYFCYSGHGNETYFGAENIWGTNLSNAADYTYPPIGMLSTCNSYCFDRTITGIAEGMLQKNNGGMIAIVASCRSVLLDANKLISEGFTEAYSKAEGTVTIGDLYVKAHDTAIANSLRLNDRLNTWCYNLVGDPAIKITMPEHDVTVTEINGTNIYNYKQQHATAAADTDTDSTDSTDSTDDIDLTFALTPQSTLNLKAYVADINGRVDETFNGKATVFIYEAPHTVSTIKVDSKDVVEDVTLDETLLTSTSVNVVKGELEANIFIPYNAYSASPTNTNRIVIVADNGEGSTAAGVNNDAFVYVANETDIPNVDITEPEISQFYIDYPSNTDGATIGTTSPTVYAKIKLGTAGLNNTGKIGSATSVSLDGVTQSDASHAIYIDSDGYAKLAYTFSDLSLGDHSVTLTVADNAGNRTAETLNFNIEELDGEVTLYANTEDVYKSISFDIEHTFYGEPDTRLIIEDSLHNTVLSVENPSFPYVWNYTDGNGKAVPNGFYNAYIQSKYGSKTAASPKQRVVVISK